MSETPVPGLAGSLGTLRHALADPLSAAGLKLELIERRLTAVPDAAPLVERVRVVKADLADAGRLLDLLTRLAEIVGQEPSEATLDELCLTAGLSPGVSEASRSPLRLRREAAGDALRIVASFVRSLDPLQAPARVSADVAPGWVLLRIEAREGCRAAHAGRLLHLPRGHEEAEGLFLARAGLEADGGRLELAQEGDRLVAILSWPRTTLQAQP